MSNQQGDEFKVGDVVWCAAFGKGCVSGVDNQSENPVTVEYLNNFFVAYTIDGKLKAEYPRTLFFTEPKIEGSITHPFVPTLVGKTVCVQYCDGRIVGEVLTETKYELFLSGGYCFNKLTIEGIYEVSSESLLKKG